MCACVRVCVPIQLPLPAHSQLNSLLKYHRCYHHISVFAFRRIYATIFLHDELERETDAGNGAAPIENLSQNSQVCGAFSELNPSLPLLNFLSHCLAPCVVFSSFIIHGHPCSQHFSLCIYILCPARIPLPCLPFHLLPFSHVDRETVCMHLALL